MQLAAQPYGQRTAVVLAFGQRRPTLRPFGTRMQVNAETKGDDFAALIEAIAAYRDRDAFGRLFDHFAPRIKGFLIRSGASPGAAEELAQEAMLSIWRKADQFDRTRAGAASWIFSIARNLRVDGLRREQRAMLIDVDPSEEPDSPPAPDAEMLAGERDARVRTALAQLPAEQLRVVQLSFFEARPHPDIADELKIPLGTVKSRLRLAVKHLRELLVNR